MSELLVRPATDDDVDDILDIEARGGREPWSADEVLGQLDHACGACMVAELHGRVVGHVLGFVVAGEGEIVTIAVDPRKQGRGLGRALVAALQDRWPCERIILEVRVDNAPARALYARTGFVEVGRRKHYYADGSDGLVLAWERPAPRRRPSRRAPTS